MISTGSLSSLPAGLRVAVISSNPVHYKTPVWRHLHQVMGVDLKVFYASLDGANAYHDPLFGRDVTWDVPLLDGYSWMLVRNKPRDWMNWRFRYNVPDIGRYLDGEGFTHILLEGKEYAYYHQAQRAARRLGLKVLYRAESHPAKSAWLGESLARISRRQWFRNVDSFLCVGRYQYAEYEQFGVTHDRLFFSPYCVDNVRFSAQHAHWSVEREDIRRGYGFSRDEWVVGYCGKLYPRKNPLELVRAVARMSVDGKKVGMLMVGDGVMRKECERLARETIKGTVVFAGFLNQSELARAYTAMDVFVVPSLWETWGLVVNEAMVCGLPVVTTTRVNAARDLIEQGVNGYTYDSGDDAALLECLNRILRKSRMGEAMGEASRRRVADYSVESSCRGIVEALTTVNHESS